MATTGAVIASVAKQSRATNGIDSARPLDCVAALAMTADTHTGLLA